MQIPSIQVPSSVIYSQEPTSREAFPNRTTFEYLSDSQSSYSFDGSNRITFTLNDASYMLDALESYVRFDLTTSLIDSAALPGAAARHELLQGSRSLTTGGAHSIFSAVEVRLSNGTILDRIEGYNLLYSITSYATHSHDHVNQIERMSGDSVDPMMTIKRQVDLAAPFVWNGAGGSSYTSATRTFVLTGGAFTNTLRAGDLIHIFDAGAFQYQTSVLSVTNNTTFIVTEDAPGANINNAGLQNFTFRVVERSFPGVDRSTRALAAQTPGCTLTMRIMSGFLQQHKLIPLPFLKNLQIVLEMTRPELHLMTSVAPNGDRFIATARIDNPRYVASLVQPSDSLLKMLSNIRANPLYMSWQSYRHSVHSIAGGIGQESVMLNVNFRSARHVIFAITTARTEAVILENNINTNTLNYDSTGTFVTAGLGQWQVRLGGRSFPDAPIKVDVLGNSTWSECLKTVGNHNHSQAEARVTARQWQSINTVSGVPNESEVFFGAIRLDSDGIMTGSSLQNQNIQLELVFSRDPPASNAAYAAAGALKRTLHAFVAGDCICQISDQGVRVFS